MTGIIKRNWLRLMTDVPREIPRGMFFARKERTERERRGTYVRMREGTRDGTCGGGGL